MIDGAADENAVGEFGDLNGENRREVTGVADFPIEGEEFLKRFRNIELGE